MSRHMFLTQFEAASSLNSFDLGVFLNFTFASSFNKMMETEQKLPNVSTAKGTIFESVDVPVALASSWQLLYFLNLVLVALKMWLSTTVWFNNRFWQQTILSLTDNFLSFGIFFIYIYARKLNYYVRSYTM